MKHQKFEEEIVALLGEDRLKMDEPLKRYTTWRVGGPADYFVETKSSAELVDVLTIARRHDMPVYLLGGGSNVLIGDKGIRGLVIRHAAREYEIIGDLQGNEQQQTDYHTLVAKWEDHQATYARHKAVHFHYYDDTDPNYGADSVFVRISSGYIMSAFIEQMFQQGITGLERFARIPGTFGGWAYNNVHAHTQFIGEFIYSVKYVDTHMMLHEKTWDDLDFDYNYSRFHNSKDVIVDGVLRLFRGNVEKAREVYKKTLTEKLQKQPGNTAGCAFHNVMSEDVKRLGFESDSIGYVMDKILHWNGVKRVGGAWVSQTHGNFIETDETAAAADIVALLDIIKDEFRNRFQIELREEFFRVGEF